MTATFGTGTFGSGTFGAAVSTTYATIDDYIAYVEGYVPGGATEQAALERELLRAERDIDRVLGPIHRDTTTGLKVDPTLLLGWERAALARAVCAQARYRITSAMSTGLVAAGVTEEQGPDFRVKYASPAMAGGVAAATGRLALVVADELEPLSFLRPRGARARP
jgi:hypothetical protein